MRAAINGLIFGYFGAGNFGDEWTLAAFLKGCRQHGCAFTPFVLSRNPAATANDHAVTAIPRQWRAVSMALSRCECVIGCGGSLLQDATSLRSLIFYCTLIVMARQFGKRTVLLAQGLGPLRRPMSRALARWALRSCHLVTFRDTVSRQLAERLGVPASLIRVTADLTFVWDEVPSRRPRFSLGVNLRPVKAPEATLRRLVEALAQWIQMFWDGQVLFLPLHHGVDDAALTDLAQHCRGTWWRRPHWQDNLDGIAQVQLLVGMRLHGLIAACLLSVPFIGLNYDPKVAGIFGDAFADRLLPLNFAPDAIAAVQRAAPEDPSRWQERTTAFVTDQKRKAAYNFELLRGVL
ncbi:hypothetical protein HRbin17_00081 [bacterium HR17]|uniref:Polysaccharide pyruvyl transferase domain-containing protein n=1 Tax=Candidatus Fervidibacter japonicus TaxID=2035412 RepID=A0A2H5X8S2_9BACT|nr:hypothetical protein HRbin17_00081 [bacterium HR17]